MTTRDVSFNYAGMGSFKDVVSFTGPPLMVTALRWESPMRLRGAVSVTAGLIPKGTEVKRWRLTSPILAELAFRETVSRWRATIWLEEGVHGSGIGGSRIDAITELVRKLVSKCESFANRETKLTSRSRFKLAALQEIIEPLLEPDIEAQLAFLSSLEPGWDSYGAPRISPIAIREARWTLRKALILGVTPPAIVPSPDGGVDLEWRLESGTELYIQISAKGIRPFLLVEQGQQGKEKESEGTAEKAQDLEELLLTLKG